MRVNEQTSLLSVTATTKKRNSINIVESEVVTDLAVVKKSNPIMIKVTSFGVGAVLIAVNLTANSLILVSEGHRGAGSLTTSFQALILGVCGGALMSGGVALGKPIGERNFIKASEIAKTSYVLTGALTAFSTLGYGATYFVFPKLFSEDIAKAAYTYFLVSALGNWPALALVTTGQIAFQAGDWKSPLVSTIMYRIPSAALSYWLAGKGGLGVAGVGLGNTIAPWVSYIGMQLWLTRQEFQHLNQAPFSRQLIKDNFKPLLKLSAKMAFQRVTEWGNLSIITSVLGAMNSNDLVILNPSLQFMTLFNLFSQGIGLGGNMIAAVQRAEMKQLMQVVRETKNEALIPELQKAQRNVKTTSVKSLSGALIVNSALAAVLFFARQPIVNLFLSSEASHEMHETAETALWISGLSLIADALRIVSGNLLNTWDKILFPNIVSLITMTIIGVPLGYLSGMHEDDESAVIPMFAVRTGMILLAALINVVVLFKEVKDDDRQIAEAIQSIQTQGLFYENDTHEDETYHPIEGDEGNQTASL